jgi:CheY-like chemotaxis protein
MPLLLAIEPDSRQASLIAGLAHGTLGAEVVVTSSASDAVAVLANRVPDLILTSLLLSPRDESLLADRLRELDAAGTRVQTLVIPVLAEPTSEPRQNKLFARLNWRRPKASGPDACSPSVFADQIAEYLKRAAADRALAGTPRSSAPASSPPVVEDARPIAPLEVPAEVFHNAVLDELAAMLAAVPLRPAVERRRAEEFSADNEIVEPPRIEQRPTPVAVRSDLLETLAAIQRDLEPLRVDRSKTTGKTAGAIQDEWGFFDPRQCGIAALFARLEHIAAERNAAAHRSA